MFERVVRAFDEQACLLGADEDPRSSSSLRSCTRETFDRIGYLQTFPQLAGTVFSFSGGELSTRRSCIRSKKASRTAIRSRRPDRPDARVLLPRLPVGDRRASRRRPGVQVPELLLPARTVRRPDAYAGLPPARARPASEHLTRFRNGGHSGSQRVPGSSSVELGIEVSTDVGEGRVPRAGRLGGECTARTRTQVRVPGPGARCRTPDRYARR